MLLRWELAAAVGMGQERAVERAAAALAAEVGMERVRAEADTEEPADTAAEADNRPASAGADTEELPAAYLHDLPSMQKDC